MRKYFTTLVFAFICSVSYAQIKPGFDKSEYLELLRLCKSVDTTKTKLDLTPVPEKFKQIYVSDEVGLKNKWSLYSDQNKIHAIVVRGSVASLTSWMENFYAAMVSANGRLELSDNFTFDYHLSDNSQANVHLGWLIGMAYLQKEIVPKLDSLAKLNEFDVYLVGHSQGGAITYLLSSHLHYLQKQGKVDSRFRFKTVTSAAPKPGNLYYAQDFEYINRDGRSYSIVNETDWVPETPFSIQTFTDFNTINPFVNIDAALNKQKLIVKLYGKKVYRQLNKSTRKAQERFEHYLGNMVSKYIKKELPEFKIPKYEKSSYYSRTGFPVILRDVGMLQDKTENAFKNHMYWTYYQLAEKLD